MRDEPSYDYVERGKVEALVAAEIGRLAARVADRDHELIRVRAELADVRAERDALREAMDIYARRDNWWQADHVDQSPTSSLWGIARKVWAWDDHREPWTMAQRALAAAPPAAERPERGGA